jgi:hypothetical protein
MLVVVTVAGVALGVIGSGAERQRRAVEAIEALGGRAWYLSDNPNRRPWAGRWLPRDWVEEPVSIQFQGDEWVGAVVHLQRLPDLRKLSFRGARVTDADLPHLHGLKRLVTLDLRFTEVTPSGVAELQNALPNCEITFSGYEILDAE